MFRKIGVTTNDTMPLDMPTDLVWVSLDGARKQHNRRRDGSFDHALHNIRGSKHGRIDIHYTVNRENIEDIPLLAETLSSEPTIRGITFQAFYPHHQGELDLALRIGRAGTCRSANPQGETIRESAGTAALPPWPRLPGRCRYIPVHCTPAGASFLPKRHND